MHSSGIDNIWHHEILNIKDVAQAINKLNPEKDDRDEGLCSDHIKCACTDLYVYVSFLLSGLIHGLVPAGLASSTIITIPKCKNDNHLVIIGALL